MERREREINLLDLLETICMKWRGIVIFLVIGLVVGGVVATAQALYNKSQLAHDAMTAKTEKTLAKAESDLVAVDATGELKKTADNNVDIYLYKESLYDMQEEYLEKSIYYSIDELNVAKNILSYHIDNHYVAEYPIVESYNNIEDVIQYYEECITSYDMYDRIIDEVYSDSEYNYIKELIMVEVVSTGNIKISIVADSEENANKISDTVQDEIMNITVNAKKLYGNVDCELQNKQSVVVSDADMVVKNTESLKKAIDLSKEMTSIAKSMSGAQLAYFDAKLNLEKVKIIDGKEQDKSLLAMISKKIILLAGIVGIILPIICIAIDYVFSGTIKTQDDLAYLTNSILLGNMEESQKFKNPLDKLVCRIFHGKQTIDASNKRIVVTNIIFETLKRNGAKSVCIVSSTQCKEDKIIIELCNGIRNERIEVFVADKFGANKEGMTLTNSADAVIICERICVANYNDIESEIGLIKANNNKILGCVAL